MPKLDLTPWQPGAVFCPMLYLVERNNLAEKLPIDNTCMSDKDIAAFNQMDDLKEILSHAVHADLIIVTISMASRKQPPK